MSELPRGWAEASLGEFCEIYQPQTIAKSNLTADGPYPVYGANGIIGRHTSYNHEDRQLLITCRGATCGSVNISQPNSWITGNAMVVRPRPDCVDLKYAEYFFRGPADYSQIITGSAQPQITRQNLAPVRFPIPPAREQRRIVAKLDSLCGLSSRARHELDRIPKLIDRYKQAILGKIYNEAMETAKSTDTLGNLAIEVRNGLSRKPEPSPPGVPILRISAVRPGRVRLDEPRFYRSPDGEGIETYALRTGDLLFTRYNGNPDLVAVCGLVRGVTSLTVYPDKLIRVRLDIARVLPQFVEIIAQSPQTRRQLEPFIKTAAGQHGISGRDLQTLSVPVPEIELQKKLIAKTAIALTWLDKIAAEHARAAHLLPKLDQAILAKAFRGELAPQDPNDEPASVLLERINAAQSIGLPSKRTSARR